MPVNLNAEIREPRVLGSREFIYATLCDNDGEPINLTGKTIVCRIVKVDSGTVAVNNAAATVDNPTAGLVHYEPSADDATALTVGEWACYFLDTTTTPTKRFPFDGPQRVLVVKAEY